MTDQPTETDPRFPSGPWRGYFIQVSHSVSMELYLEFRGGCVQGEGDDAVGPFSLRGTYDLENGTVIFDKHYHLAHHVDYDGRAGPDSHIRGRWDIHGGQGAGPWHIWPVEDKTEDAAVGTKEESVGISNWSEFEHSTQDALA